MPAGPSAGATSKWCWSRAPRRCTPGRCRGGTRPSRLAARSGQAGPGLGQPARRGHARADQVRDRQARGYRPGDEPGRHPPHPCLPALRERAAGGQRMDAGGARGAHRVDLVALQPGGGAEPPRLDPQPAHRRGDRPALGGQPDGVVPLSQAVHGQHGGGPGCGLHRLLGRGGPGGRGARGALGLPALGGRCQRPLVHFAPPRAAPLAGHPNCRRGGSGAGRRAWCRWQRRNSAWRSTTRRGRSP